MTPTPTPLEEALAPALADYRAALDAHGHTAGRAYDRCKCGWVPKAGGRQKRRAVGLHIAAAERRASRAYDAAADAIIRAGVR